MNAADEANRAATPGWRRVFLVPLCVAAAGILGFVAAFVSEEFGRYLCWFGIGSPLVLIARFAIRDLGQHPGKR